jgi:hypothetical protein
MTDFTALRQVGVDKDRLTLWRTARGSSSNEGFHNHIHEDLNAENCGLEFVHLLLHAFIDRWNRAAAVRHIPGTVDYKHYNLQYKEETNTIFMELCGVPRYPDLAGRNEFYVPGQTTVGVTNIFNEDPTAHLVSQV